MNYTLKTKSTNIDITPYGMSKISEAFYNTANNFNTKDYFLVHLFLYCASIEIGLKACILSKDNSYCGKMFVRCKIGHDLNEVIKGFNKLFNNEINFNLEDLKNIKKINKYYSKKGLEYFTGDVIYSLATCGVDFPSSLELKKIGKKVNNFLKKNNYFQDK